MCVCVTTHREGGRENNILTENGNVLKFKQPCLQIFQPSATLKKKNRVFGEHALRTCSKKKKGEKQGNKEI